MPTDAIAADNSALNIEQAVMALSAEPEKREDETPEAPTTTELEAEPAADNASEPETATEGETSEGEAEKEGDEPQPEPIEPPKFWDADKKKLFSALPREVQEYVLTKETERDKATAKAIEEAATKRKAADSEASRITQLTGVLDKLIPQAEQQFARWPEKIDWNQVVQERGADEAFKLKNQYEQEQAQLQQLRAAKQQAEQVQYQKFVEAETAKLPALAPELADPQHGKQRMEELSKFLLASGVSSDDLKYATASQVSLAYDAMRWRNAQAEAKAKASTPKAQPQAAPSKPVVRPTAAPQASNPQTARVQQLLKKSSLTIDEATELATLRGH